MGEGRRGTWAVAAVLLAAAAVTHAGWRTLWFLTDDAFIAFRYVGNSMLGRGLVWNPEPFAPVEGYTSWLWVVVLRWVWTWTGVEPPEASNPLALALGWATLGLGALFVLRMQLPPALARRRALLLALAFAFVVTNRTFLAWLSSGLETSLFNFTLTLWAYLALRPPGARGAGWAAAVSTAATLTALTRPDGLLVFAGTAALLLADALQRRGTRPLRFVLGALPLVGVPAHLLWRRSFYGEWLPNTYYAKHVEAWPESGLRYAASFVLEYALWVWAAVALVWLVRRRRLSLHGLLVVGVLGGHFLYYTLVIGGDHFEYRVYSHLVLLLAVSLVWFAGRLDLSLRTTVALLLAQTALSWPVPWTHWALTHELATREQTHKLVRPVAPAFPPGTRWYARAFDGLQGWLIPHHVGMRHQEHKVFHRHMTDMLPGRAAGLRLDWAERGVTRSGNVGVLGWVAANVAIVDTAGLNDWVIARYPSEIRYRKMAHDRRPPPGYVNCFAPNLTVVALPDRKLFVLDEREAPLTDEDIRSCERRFREEALEARREAGLD